MGSKKQGKKFGDMSLPSNMKLNKAPEPSSESLSQWVEEMDKAQKIFDAYRFKDKEDFIPFLDAVEAPSHVIYQALKLAEAAPSPREMKLLAKNARAKNSAVAKAAIYQAYKTYKTSGKNSSVEHFCGIMDEKVKYASGKPVRMSTIRKWLLPKNMKLWASSNAPAVNADWLLTAKQQKKES